ncbi:39S ribosomal protein L49, mitochondrial [Trichonephila clavipes]|uniref:Large ribosomal subunit protein mL49 n=1 Tax=Trichonephila clavipes TaxID=2585209 RepID=A0A8X7BFA1_TRICX|nr:39S ribosomal protein L49, mitochondrial [Trichonephila clavipes]
MFGMCVSVKELWELDVLGITDPLLNENTKENFELTDFKNKMKILPNGRYEVKLPWKCNSENLPSNKELTWKRHLRMMNKLRNGKFFEDYKSVFRQWENLNIIEHVPEVELNNECHYLPHRPVIKLDSATTKIRPVFDASAREKGKPSLNDCLYKGVNLIELIPDILDRFRIYPVGIVADIEKAFLMLSVAPKDRDYLRFFFPCNECRVVFGVSSSPYLLNASIMHLLENCNSECKEVAQKLKSSFYVDNCVTGVFSANEIVNLVFSINISMSERCFNLRIFGSNVASKSVDKHSGETFILGIIWDLDNDVLKCCTNFDSLTCEVKITKRLVLSTVQKVFDPIGMMAPSTLLPKLLLQEIWKMKKAWDQELPQNIVNKFMKWFNEIQILKGVSVPRCMKIDSFTELHVFVDASKGSYAGCVFARSIVDSRVSVILVRAKSRVAPLKLLSIPRLELMACCVGVRLVNSILKALNMPDLKVTLWSDSTTALWWIKEYGNWSVFVANRVKEIRQLTKIQSWKYVPGNINIADLLSRGCSPRQMLSSRWWEGPSWLKQNSEYWPDEKGSVWIIRARKTIKSILNECFVCARFKVKSLSSGPSLLPPDRVNDCAIFEVLGIDLAGPLFLKTGEKVWITLFTCAVYRALHLELVNALSSDAFLLAFRRFIARRGRPRIIYCDNGTNFRGAFNDLAKLDWHKISRDINSKNSLEIYIPPTAAWWGGWWERLVRIIKELLRRSLGKSILSYEELSTVICECEFLINSRPLTYISENPQELIPLTPAMFLIENRCSDTTDIDELNSTDLRKRMKYRIKLLSDLRQRFRKEYLSELIQKQNDNRVREPRIGEMVLIGIDNKKRLSWPIAKIIELIPGRDGKIRTVRLKTQHGTVIRPVQRIFPLEVQAIANSDKELKEESISVKSTKPEKGQFFRAKVIPKDIWAETEDPKYTGVEEVKNRWHFVERLFPKLRIPQPPQNYSTTGWKASAETVPNEPYFIERTRNHMLPVYESRVYKDRVLVTQVRKIQGDIWVFEQDLKNYLHEKLGEEVESHVNEMCCFVNVKGRYVNEIKEWLYNKGF